MGQFCSHFAQARFGLAKPSLNASARAFRRDKAGPANPGPSASLKSAHNTQKYAVTALIFM
jgi:hypothetical protein